MEDKLQAGATVADIGCGLGASTILLAQHYPSSRFTGSDYHDESIEMARKHAADMRLSPTGSASKVALCDPISPAP